MSEDSQATSKFDQIIWLATQNCPASRCIHHCFGQNASHFHVVLYGPFVVHKLRQREKEQDVVKHGETADADDVDCDNMAMMSQGGLSHGKTVSKKDRRGERGVVNCEVSCDWRFLAQARGTFSWQKLKLS